MREPGHHHCQNCGVAFESQAAMTEHMRKEHSDQADGAEGRAPEGESVNAGSTTSRKNREFTRRHLE